MSNTLVHDQLALLLTVARLMRANMKRWSDREPFSREEHEDDLWALNEALKPFDPNPEHGGDFQAVVQ